MANASDITESRTAIATNTSGVSANRQSIDVNSQNIANNSASIALALSGVEDNTAAILSNVEAIDNLAGGVAAVAALPDMYLSPGAKWSASGGVGFYGDKTGVGATLAVRGNENWAFGASLATGGDKATGKLQVRYEGF